MTSCPSQLLPAQPTTEAFSVVEVRGTLEELRALFLQGVVEESKRTAKSAGKKVVKRAASAVPRKLSAWQRYMKQKKNHIKFKSGKMKGRLNLKAMAVKFRRGRK